MEATQTETYILSQCTSVASCVKLLSESLGLLPHSDPGTVTAASVNFSGVFSGGGKVLAKCRMVLYANGITLEICVRAADAALVQKFCDGIQ